MAGEGKRGFRYVNNSAVWNGQILQHVYVTCIGHIAVLIQFGFSITLLPKASASLLDSNLTEKVSPFPTVQGTPCTPARAETAQCSTARSLEATKGGVGR